MGSMADKKLEKSGSKRGSVNNEGRLKKLLNKTGNGGGKADWTGADPRWVAAVVTAVTGQGGAVSFGYSRDGGAYSVGVFLDGDRETLWINGSAEINDELEAIWHMFDTFGG